MGVEEALKVIESIDFSMFSPEEQCAMTMAIVALETQVAKEPLNQQGDPVFGYCPNCGSAIYKWLSKLACKECLQRLKWGE